MLDRKESKEEDERGGGGGEEEGAAAKLPDIPKRRRRNNGRKSFGNFDFHIIQIIYLSSSSFYMCPMKSHTGSSTGGLQISEFTFSDGKNCEPIQ